MLQAIKNFFLSSTGEGLSLRLKSLTTLIVFAGGLLGFVVNTDQLNGLFDVLALSVTAIGTLISAATYARAHARMIFYRENKLGRFSK
jgi:hypothetical protein